tara:strand:- start:15 stop:1142 length:1128 start_codon:yes stop_codon:yes gene_type:complete
MANFDSFETLQVQCASHVYPIHIGQKFLSRTLLLPFIQTKKIFLVTDSNVAPLWLGHIKQCFVEENVAVYIMPAGESNKSFASWTTLLEQMIEHELNRDSLLIAFGGGVVGDLAGFAASCYQRGLPFLQIPTTLLSQVDASVGGKTGINFMGEKNVIGSFHSPNAVFIDVSLLKTLAKRDFVAGLAEVIKYALIQDSDFFLWLSQSLPRILEKNTSDLIYVIKRCCLIKADIVSKDENDQGFRALLNLGHTFAHALESITDQKRWLHGEAVAIGLHCQALLSYSLGLLKQEDVLRIITLLKQSGLPCFIPVDIDLDRLIELMLRDKKVLKSRLRFVVLNNIGSAHLEVVSDLPLIKSVLKQAVGDNNDDNGYKFH